MKDKKWISMAALPVVLTAAVGTSAVIRAFVPMAILPKLDIPNMVLLSLISLLIRHYFAGDTQVRIVPALLLSTLAFGLLPLAAGLAAAAEAWKLAAMGGVVYTAAAWLFDEMVQWLSSGSGSKAVPVLGALGLYLAVQCFAGILL